MNEYWKFDVVRFLKDSRRWKKELICLKRKRDSMCDLKALPDGTPVQTSVISDTVGMTAIKISPLSDQIARLERQIRVLDTALARLDKKEREAVDLFFFSKRMVGAGIDEFCDRHDCQRNTVYNIRAKALGKLSDYISTHL